MQISHLFKCHGSRSSGEYTDYDLTDTGKNSVKRFWVLTHDTLRDEWSGYLQRSETEESAFDHCDVVLPRRFVEALRETVKRGA